MHSARAALGSRYVGNVGWMLAGQGFRLLVQALYFILIARALGVSEYGAFVGATALVAIISPFGTWGAGGILIKNVVRDPKTFSHYWGAGLNAAALSAGVLGVLALALARLILPPGIPTLLIVEIILSDLLCARLVELGGQAFQAFHKLSRTATMQFLTTFARLLAAMLLLAIHPRGATALMWSGLYLTASAMSACIVLVWVRRELGAPLWSARYKRAEIAEGFQFSVTNSAATIYNDIDKTMLARLASLEAAGFYAAAYRILDVSFVPIRSMLYASYSRFFAAGTSGISGTIRLARRLLPFALVYALVATGALLLFAPLVPHLLGPAFESCVPVLRLLSVLPLLRALHYFAANALTGADRQGIRSSIQALVAIGNIVLNLWLIPRYSWRGAVWSTLASDALLAIGLWLAIALMHNRSRRFAAQSLQDSTLRAEATLA